MRKTLKILHTLSACGLIGGIACQMILLGFAQQEAAAAYAETRQTVAAIADYVLLPSMAVALVSGLLSIAVHKPFQDKIWVWIKAASGILVFKGVLTVVADATNLAALAAKAETAEASAALLSEAASREWGLLIVVLALAIANVVLGIWRPLQIWRKRVQEQRTATPAVARRW